MNLEYFLKTYLRERPLFLSLIRAKEALLYQKYLPLKKPILDVGCGDGFFAKVAFGKKYIDVGLDVEDSRVEEAKNLGVYKKIVIYDGQKIPFPDKYFSTVVSNSVLEHVSDLDIVLKEIYRVLKPGGLFITIVMAKPWEENLFGAKLLGDFYKKWMRRKQVHVNLLKKEEWDNEFRKAGLKIGETVGHLTPISCRWIDLLHYISIPSLLSYKLFGKWVLFPDLAKNIYPLKYLAKIVSENVPSEKSGAIFYVLKKRI
ncbi:hypothetical protein A2773_00485 [Candidatus Gottesmanbacteria bacterium RIFCSPHIGHO2_01_FULL_39_10]|uniref:Methyltransferase type 11 domain-containing protein n=1 Tax=Candidatus Gottesmanbacteria bacterium RIFCSPHIGHO2_01_FULL_39_10 TaxID=1798375 RepID=A0A1F5ZMZ3_9BACT|nr:MAG: hypothetical protein A2773_00485 [Candidatus Gottesmanbacteria bacterium RIFCSPHIGHO2_01_FULL_39_10]